MKKNISKALLFIGCVAIIVFLLLPFLETTAPQKQTEASTPKKATPQIFTSNPLTELVNRIARLFGRKAGKSQKSPSEMTNQEAEELFGIPQNNGEYADARAAVENYISTEKTPAAGANRSAGFENAYFEDEEGEWVLIQQKSPELKAPGMHEINSKDNPYESYIRQERIARFTPVAKIRKEKEVPDSKLARFFNPIKRFFGFTDDTEWIRSKQLEGDMAASNLGSSQGSGKSRNEQGSAFNRGGNMNIQGISGRIPTAYPGQQSNMPLLSYLDPQSMLDEVSNFLADSKYPNPQNEQERQKKEEYRQQRREDIFKEFTLKVQERMNRLAEGKEPEDELGGMLEVACSLEDIRPVKSTQCSIGSSAVPAPASADQIKQAQQENAASFQKKTGLTMPAAPIMPVLGKASRIPEIFEEDASSIAYQKTTEIYQFMYDNKNCKNESCYWVANSIQKNTELSDSIEAAGVKLHGDPLGKYNDIQQQFVAAKLAQQQQEGGNSNLDPQTILKETEEYAPPYIVYTMDELKLVQLQNQEAVKNKDMSAGIALYAVSAPIAKQMTDDLGSTTFFYGKDSSLIDADQYPSFKERSEILTRDLGDQIQFFQQVFNEIKRNASREVVTEHTRAKAEEIHKQAQKERALFDKTNQLGKTERGQ